MIGYRDFHSRLHAIFSQERGLNSVPLEALLDRIPTVDNLAGVRRGETVLIRLDLDMPVQQSRVVDLARIRANAPTISFCLDHGCRVVIFGHLGRRPEQSVVPVRDALSEEIRRPIEFVPEWLDLSRDQVTDEFLACVGDSPPSSVFMLENTRKYSIERALWDAKGNDFERICRSMHAISGDIRRRLCSTFVNEAFAASNLDFSSTAVPLAMSECGLGFYASEEFRNHVRAAREADFVVISGMKMNKLDDLESVLKRGVVSRLIVAGCLAMALRKAEAELDGETFNIGRAETDENAKGYVSPSRLEQAKRIVRLCRETGVMMTLPIDFVLDSGEVGSAIPSGASQLDVGPRSRSQISEVVEDYIRAAKKTAGTPTVFYNGVFGMFEDPRYEAGTREFIAQLERMTEAGIRTFVGGGEGRLALQKYGRLDRVTHAFTAGGTILKSLGTNQIAYLKALYLQNGGAGAQK